MSSEEVRAGKPSPDVYREAVRRLTTSADHAAIEDSTNGLLAPHARRAALHRGSKSCSSAGSARPARRREVLGSIAELTAAVVPG